jgi:hypothetical protein
MIEIDELYLSVSEWSILVNKRITFVNKNTGVSLMKVVLLISENKR